MKKHIQNRGSGKPGLYVSKLALVVALAFCSNVAVYAEDSLQSEDSQDQEEAVIQVSMLTQNTTKENRMQVGWVPDDKSSTYVSKLICD